MDPKKKYYARFDTAIRLECGTLVDLNTGQCFRQLTHRVCRKTGLLADDGSQAFADKGFLFDIELIGGPYDGHQGQVHDVGGIQGCIGMIEGHCMDNDCPDCWPT